MQHWEAAQSLGVAFKNRGLCARVFTLQYVARSQQSTEEERVRVADEPDIFNAAGTGNRDLVFYYLIADLHSAKECNAKSQWQENVLHWAVKCGGLEVSRWLMQFGADPYERDEVGYNSIDYAIHSENFGVRRREG